MAPVPFDSYAPFDDGAGANITELQWRQFMRLTVDAGLTTGNGVIRSVNNELLVYGDSSGAQVKVKTGEVWIQGTWGTVNGEKTVPIAIGDATNPRIDVVVARADYANNVIELAVVQGTPGAVPVAPSLTISGAIYEIPLAQVSVPALDNNIASSQVFDCRRFQDVPSPVVRCTTDVTVNNSTTFVDVPGCSILVGALAAYFVDGFLEYDAATAADIKFQITGPTGSSGKLLFQGAHLTVPTVDNTTFVNFGANSSIPLGGIGVGTRLGVHVSGWLQTPAVHPLADPLTNPIKFKLQFAQNTANASNASVYTNSWLRFFRFF